VGAPRRFDLLGSWRGVDVYESYAHLPGEIAAILSATRAAGYERITAVFQPHRVTRTLALVDDFAPSFDLATTVIVTDIYTCRRRESLGRHRQSHRRRHHPVATPASPRSYCASTADLPDVLEGVHGLSDVVVLLGAGDVASIAARTCGVWADVAR
jgi:UDP-N-acetylmuramate--alanine ligase